MSTWSTNTCARGSTRVPSGAQCARLGCIATVWTATFGGLREPSAHRRTMCISPRCDYVLPVCFACTLLATGLRAADTAKDWQSRHVRKALTRICTCTHHGSHHGLVLCMSFERLRSFLNSAWAAASAAQTYWRIVPGIAGLPGGCHWRSESCEPTGCHSWLDLASTVTIATSTTALV